MSSPRSAPLNEAIFASKESLETYLEELASLLDSRHQETLFKPPVVELTLPEEGQEEGFIPKPYARWTTRYHSSLRRTRIDTKLYRKPAYLKLVGHLSGHCRTARPALHGHRQQAEH